jgi:hypothetical protein
MSNFFQWVKNRFKRDEFGLHYVRQNPFKRQVQEPPSSKIHVTRKDKKQSKTRRRMAKESRRINRGKKRKT